ncbi:MAG: hypothetical protein JW726_04785 [Anaerolineales bacterium]|nr:hypothetical protein [Anaerolineales bacterium]
MKKVRYLRCCGAVLLLLVSCILLVWGLWPLGSAVQTAPILPGDMQLPTPENWVPLARMFV